MRSFFRILWSTAITYSKQRSCRALCAGLLVACGFAPFHLSGIAILGLALLFRQLHSIAKLKSAFTTGLVFALGFLGLGVSWVSVSIHTYGHLNVIVSALITGLFIVYLALFFGLIALAYVALKPQTFSCLAALLFSALWCSGEYLRAHCLTGFPWLLLGFGQMDSPLRHLMPVIGLYGTSFITCLVATCLALACHRRPFNLAWLSTFIALLLMPNLLSHSWTTLTTKPLSVSVVQANLSMRDKWDERVFWQILHRYEQYIQKLLGKQEVIVLPESALPIPASYIRDFLDQLSQKAQASNTAIVLGIPQAADEMSFYNTMIGLGSAEGLYRKQHLVPFGEYIPMRLRALTDWLQITLDNTRSGSATQPLLRVHQQAVASLICYELAYPELIRKQMPEAQWIISVSDDGWFGHSFAMYQHLQMAQAISLLTGRYQVVANNNGLSSIINAQGQLIATSPAYSADVLSARLHAATGMTPWSIYGDAPIGLMCSLIIAWAVIRKKYKPQQLEASSDATSSAHFGLS